MLFQLWNSSHRNFVFWYFEHLVCFLQNIKAEDTKCLCLNQVCSGPCSVSAGVLRGPRPALARAALCTCAHRTGQCCPLRRLEFVTFLGISILILLFKRSFLVLKVNSLSTIYNGVCKIKMGRKYQVLLFNWVITWSHVVNNSSL